MDEDPNIAAIRRILRGLDEMEAWMPELRARAEELLAAYLDREPNDRADLYALHQELVDRMDLFGTAVGAAFVGSDGQLNPFGGSPFGRA